MRDASGFEGSKSIDSVAFGLYASRGYEIHAFECKAHRSDWLKELRQPDKADRFVKLVDKFWVVAGEMVVKAREMPKGWGLITVFRLKSGFRSRIQKQATLQDWASDPLPRPFIAAMLTRMRKELEKWKRGSVLKSEFASKLAARYKDGVEAGKREALYDIGDSEKVMDQVKAFEEASGIEISRYTRGAELGKRVALVAQLQRYEGWQSIVGKSTTFAESLRNIAQEVESRAKEVEDLRLDMLTPYKELSPETQARHERLAQELLDSGEDELELGGNPVYDK